MPPKKAAATSNEVHIVVIEGHPKWTFATKEAAEDKVNAMSDEGSMSVEILTQELQGGSITIDEKKAPKKAAAKSKPAKASKSDDTEAPAPKANTAAKKTKPVEEQRAETAKKPAKTSDADLPENVKALLAGKGTVLDGMSIVVTGVPPTLTRKHAEELVKQYGGKLLKSLSKNTDFVVVGNGAGPKKLDQIDQMGIETKDEDEFIALLESGGAGTKRGASDDEEDEEEEEEEEVVKPAKGKKQKR